MAGTTPEYQAEYRRNNETYAERNRMMNKVRDQAKQRIVDLHRTEYEAILAEMKRKAGL